MSLVRSHHWRCRGFRRWCDAHRSRIRRFRASPSHASSRYCRSRRYTLSYQVAAYEGLCFQPNCRFRDGTRDQGEAMLCQVGIIKRLGPLIMTKFSVAMIWTSTRGLLKRQQSSWKPIRCRSSVLQAVDLLTRPRSCPMAVSSRSAKSGLRHRSACSNPISWMSTNPVLRVSNSFSAF